MDNAALCDLIQRAFEAALAGDRPPPDRTYLVEETVESMMESVKAHAADLDALLDKKVENVVKFRDFNTFGTYVEDEEYSRPKPKRKSKGKGKGKGRASAKAGKIDEHAFVSDSAPVAKNGKVKKGKAAIGDQDKESEEDSPPKLILKVKGKTKAKEKTNSSVLIFNSEEEDVAVAAESPPIPKEKAKGKKSVHFKEGEKGATDAAPRPVPRKSRRKKGALTPDDEGEDVPVAAESVSMSKKMAKTVQVAEREEDTPVAASPLVPKKTRGEKRALTPEDDGEDGAAVQTAPPPAKRTRAGKKAEKLSEEEGGEEAVKEDIAVTEKRKKNTAAVAKGRARKKQEMEDLREEVARLKGAKAAE